MIKEEIGQMESELHSIEMRVCDMMSDDQKGDAISDLAVAILAINERLKKLEDVVSYVNENTTLDI